jgi:capsular polysaccharide biosynthesis protein
MKGTMVDFWDLTKLLARRWLIAVPMLALSAVLTVLTVGSMRPDYVATAYVQLVAPVEGATKPGEAGAGQRNPWLGQGLQTVGNAAIITVLDKTVVEELAAAGLSDSYTLTMDATSPMVAFEVVGDSEQQARETAERLVERFRQSVAKLQADDGVTAKDAIRTRRLDLGTNIEESNSKVKRALVAVAGAGMLMTIAVTVGVDALLRRRRRAQAAVPTPATLISAHVRRPQPEVPEVGTPTSGVSARPAEAGETAKILVAKAAESPPLKAAGATPPTVVVDYQSSTGVSKPTASTDADRTVASRPELPADATIVLPLSMPAKGDWPGRNGEKKKHP